MFRQKKILSFLLILLSILLIEQNCYFVFAKSKRTTLKLRNNVVNASVIDSSRNLLIIEDASNLDTKIVVKPSKKILKNGKPIILEGALEDGNLLIDLSVLGPAHLIPSGEYKITAKAGKKKLSSSFILNAPTLIIGKLQVPIPDLTGEIKTRILRNQTTGADDTTFSSTHEADIAVYDSSLNPIAEVPIIAVPGVEILNINKDGTEVPVISYQTFSEIPYDLSIGDKTIILKANVHDIPTAIGENKDLVVSTATFTSNIITNTNVINNVEISPATNAAVNLLVATNTQIQDLTGSQNIPSLENLFKDTVDLTRYATNNAPTVDQANEAAKVALTVESGMLYEIIFTEIKKNTIEINNEEQIAEAAAKIAWKAPAILSKAPEDLTLDINGENPLDKVKVDTYAAGFFTLSDNSNAPPPPLSVQVLALNANVVPSSLTTSDENKQQASNRGIFPPAEIKDDAAQTFENLLNLVRNANITDINPLQFINFPIPPGVQANFDKITKALDSRGGTLDFGFAAAPGAFVSGNTGNLMVFANQGTFVSESTQVLNLSNLETNFQYPPAFVPPISGVGFVPDSFSKIFDTSNFTIVSSEGGRKDVGGNIFALNTNTGRNQQPASNSGSIKSFNPSTDTAKLTQAFNNAGQNASNIFGGQAATFIVFAYNPQGTDDFHTTQQFLPTELLNIANQSSDNLTSSSSNFNQGPKVSVGTIINNLGNPEYKPPSIIEPILPSTPSSPIISTTFPLPLSPSFTPPPIQPFPTPSSATTPIQLFPTPSLATPFPTPFLAPIYFGGGGSTTTTAPTYTPIPTPIPTPTPTPTPDTTPPTVSSFSPADNATGILNSSNLVITFSENVQAGTGNILIKKSSDNTIVETIDVTNTLRVTFSTTMATIDPTSNLTDSTGYYVQIASTAIKDSSNNNYAGISDATTWNFITGDSTLPLISSLSPADDATGASISANLVITFSENVQAGTGNILIKKSSDNSIVETIDVTNTLRVTFSTTMATIDPTSNLTDSTGYYVQIDSTAIKDSTNNNFAGISTTTTWNFTTGDFTPPTVSSFSPADNATGILNSSNLVITFSENVQAGTGNILIKKSSDNTIVETIDVTNTLRVTFSTTMATIDPTSNLIDSTGYYVQIDSTAIKDSSNNNYAGISDATTWSLTTGDSTLPLISSLSPADDATGASVSANLVITFSENVQAGTGNIVIKKSSDNTIVETIDVTNTLRVTFSTTMATIDPTSNLTDSTGYYVQIASTAIKDSSNNNYAGISDATTWNFTTGDFTAPTVSSFSPLDDATDITASSNLVITFNENVQAGTGNIVIKKSSDNTIVETIDVTGARVTFSTTMATIDPTANLADSTGYYVQIDSTAIKDSSNNNYAGISTTTTWSFTTAAAADTTAPTVSSFSPIDNASGISTSANISITFSENVQAGTGNIVIKKTSDNSTVETIAVTGALVTFSTTMATINPTSNFANSTGYYVQIDSTAIKDSANNNYAGISTTTTWNFTTGPNSAGTVANDTGVGTVVWGTPTNATTSDTAYATAALTASTSNYLKATNFGFNIPTGSTINGITVAFQRKVDNSFAPGLDNAIRIVKGGTIGTTDKSSATAWSTTESYVSYGSSTDLWGTTWTAEDINLSTFGAALSSRQQNAEEFTTHSVNHIRITVDYTPP